MYRIDGIDLHNKEFGWKLRRTSETRPVISSRVTSLVRPGRDGIVTPPTTRSETSMSFVIDVPNSTLNKLLTLMSSQSLTITNSDRPGIRAIGRLLTATPEESHRALGWDRYAFLIEIPTGRWESVSPVTTDVAPASPGGNIQLVLDGMTAPVQEGMIRFVGPITNPQVTDYNTGAFVRINETINAGYYVRYDIGSCRAWVTTEDTWSGGTEISGQIDFGGPRKAFEIVPTFDPETLESRGRIVYSAASGSGGIQLRAHTPYLTD